MPKFKLNKLDANGYIILGYEDIVECDTKEEAIRGYLDWLDDNTTSDRIECEKLESIGKNEY